MVSAVKSTSYNRLPTNQLSVTKEEANRTFWRLGDRFWMQIIDGKFHDHGAMVFDQGLHNSLKEPGFFQSLKKGCDFASAYLTQNLSLRFYKDLHKVICSHFKGKENNTCMTFERTGRFRRSRCSSQIPLLHLSKMAQVHLNILKGGASSIGYSQSKIYLSEYYRSWEDRIIKLNDYISKLCTELSIPLMVKFEIKNKSLHINYLINSPITHIELVYLFFSHYKESIEQIDERLKFNGDKDSLFQEKLVAIAKLYQQLEWLHPFPDGQGRSDLVLLSKLLSEEGFNPAILDDPYFSTYSSLEEWTEYLKDGMQAWQDEAFLKFYTKAE